MRTLPTKLLSGAMVALTVLACLSAARVQAEERDAKLREQALKLNKITGTEARYGEQEKLLKDKAAAKKLVAEAARMAAEKPQPFNYNATLILGAIAIDKKIKDYNAAETFYQLHLEQAKQLRSAKGLMAGYGGLINAVYHKRNYAQTEKLCEEVSKNETLIAPLQNLAGEGKGADGEVKELKSFISSVLETQIKVIALQGDADRAIKMIDRLLGEESDSWVALDLKGLVFRFAGKDEEAIKAYQDEIQQLKDDNDLKKKDKEEQLDNVRYSMSSVYIELGQVDKAAEQLKKLLEKHPDNPTYNNDLGYVWADHDMNLAESEKLIRKALEEDRKQRQKKAKAKAKPEEIKEQGAYLDSLGWVLYKQKKYVEAKRYLRQAVQNTMEEDDGNESIEIYDHLGDVLMALGQKAEAVAVWKKGIEVAGDTKREQKRKEEVQKKIKANK
ncbi:MAG TPA: tetratricopeptide repeat protein [Gemmataceae bacterium]|nr:tetratricopeptide repeat protein [Gemmataceae bacterium]